MQLGSGCTEPWPQSRQTSRSGSSSGGRSGRSGARRPSASAGMPLRTSHGNTGRSIAWSISLVAHCPRAAPGARSAGKRAWSPGHVTHSGREFSSSQIIELCTLTDAALGLSASIGAARQLTCCPSTRRTAALACWPPLPCIRHGRPGGSRRCRPMRQPRLQLRCPARRCCTPC